MPLPHWLGQLNKRFFNPMEIKKGTRPVLVHKGRESGSTYRTPLDAHPVEHGWLFIVNYGPDCDWVRNIEASSSATLEIDGRSIALTDPRLVPIDNGFEFLAPDASRPPKWARVGHCLLMSEA